MNKIRSVVGVIVHAKNARVSEITIVLSVKMIICKTKVQDSKAQKDVLKIVR